MSIRLPGDIKAIIDEMIGSDTYPMLMDVRSRDAGAEHGIKVFQEIWIKDKKVLAVTPKPEFKPFFELNFECQSKNIGWRPRGDSNPRSPP